MASIVASFVGCLACGSSVDSVVVSHHGGPSADRDEEERSDASADSVQPDDTVPCTGESVEDRLTGLAWDHPVDRSAYVQPPAVLCAVENPCVAGECEGDTNPCFPEAPGVSLVIGSVQQLAELEDCTSFRGSLEFVGPALTSLEGLSLLAITGDLRILTAGLESLQGLESLVSVAGNVFLGDGRSLVNIQDMTGLSGLRYVGNAFHVDGAPALETLDGLAAEAIGHLRISNAPELHDVSAVSHSCVHQLSLENLPHLSALEQLPVRQEMRLIELRNLPAIESLDGLDELTRVGSLLRIIGLPALMDFSALDQLVTVDQLDLAEVPGLTDFRVFQGLEFIDQLSLGSGAPTSLGGLDQLLFLGELTLLSSHPGMLDYSGVPSLLEVGALDTSNGVRLDGLEHVEYVWELGSDGSVPLDPLASVQTISLFSFDGVAPLPPLPPSLSCVNGLAIRGTTSRDLAVFDGIANIEGLSIWNSHLESLDGLHHDGAFEQGLSLVGNPDLDLSALSGVTRMQGLSVQAARQSTLAGLEHLTTINGGLTLEGSELRDLHALSGLEEVHTWIRISDNPVLDSLEGLSNLTDFDPQGMSHNLVIEDNPRLPRCQVDAMYERFGLPASGVGNDETASCD